MGAQFAAIFLGVFAITGEYRTGQIRSTFNADPRRVRVLTAKAAIVGLAASGTTVASAVLAAIVAAVVAAVTGHGLTLGWTGLWVTPTSSLALAPLARVPRHGGLHRRPVGDRDGRHPAQGRVT